MKARVKSTGVLVDVTPQLNINSQHSRDYLWDSYEEALEAGLQEALKLI